MTDEVLMMTSDIARLLGHNSLASTRRWISRHGLEAKARDTDTGEKLYPRSAVERAIRSQPGQGARTDLRASAVDEGPRRHDGDVPTGD